MNENESIMKEWWPVLFIFGFLAALFIFVFTVGVKTDEHQHDAHQAGAQSQQPGTQGQQAPLTPQEQFWVSVEEHKPVYSPVTSNCPIDDTPVELKHVESDNRLGGVATDLMKVALGPPPTGVGRPDFELQEFEQLLGTCPECGATFMQIDLINIRSLLGQKAIDALKDWDLADAAPALADKPFDTWTYDEKSLARYLTLKQAGFPHYELGFYALSGAYCSNFAVWYGREYTIPSPAFYALAAAEFASDLEHGRPERISERAPVALSLAELYRLLDRPDEANKWFETAIELFQEASDTGGMQPESIEHYLKVTSAMHALVGQRDLALQVVNIPGMPPPPLGNWYLEEMLPNINGHIIEHRPDWAGLTDPGKITTNILGLYK